MITGIFRSYNLFSFQKNENTFKQSQEQKLQVFRTRAEKAEKVDNRPQANQTICSFRNKTQNSLPPIIYKKFTGSLNSDGSVNSNAPNTKRFYASLGFPEMVANVIFTGDYSMNNAEYRDKLSSITFGYFKEIKTLFGCNDENYLPYVPGLPEFNPEITSQMQQALFKKIEADPEALNLIKAVGGIWPIPTENWNKFSTPSVGDAPLCAHEESSHFIE